MKNRIGFLIFLLPHLLCVSVLKMYYSPSNSLCLCVSVVNKVCIA